MKKQVVITVLGIILIYANVTSQTPGTIDESFGESGVVLTDFDNDFNTVTKVLVQDDGKIIVCGYTGYTLDDQTCNLARYSSEGELDNTFGIGGKVSFSFGGNVNVANDMALTLEGKILVAGYSNNGPTYNFSIARITSAGSLDATFGVNGIKTTDLGHDEFANSILVQDDGKIVVLGQISYSGGGGTDMVICRYQANGTTDFGFGANGHIIYDLNIQSTDMPKGLVMHQGKILACSYAYNGNASDYDAVVLARFNLDGSPDVSFGVAGFSVINGLTINNMILFPDTDVAIAPDDKIVVSAHFNSLDGFDFAILRFLSNGYPDNTFNGDGIVVTDMIGENSPASIAVQPDGKILAGGYHIGSNGYDFCLARYLDNGDLDADFGNYYGVSFQDISFGGGNDAIITIDLQADNKIIVAGYAENSNGSTDFAIVRYFSGLTTNIEMNNRKNLSFQIFPNPVTNKEIHCAFLLNRNEMAEISLYSTDGRKIAQLMNEMKLPGYHEQTLNLPGNIRAGNYILQFSTSKGTEFEKVIVMEP